MSIRSNVDARKLDQRVTFQRRASSQTASGELVPTWPVVKKVWAAVDGAKARPEPAADGQILSQSDYIVWVRADVIKRFSIVVTDRISWNGMLLNIKDMPDQQLRGRLIAIICNAGLNEG